MYWRYAHIVVSGSHTIPETSTTYLHVQEVGRVRQVDKLSGGHITLLWRFPIQDQGT